MSHLTFLSSFEIGWIQVCLFQVGKDHLYRHRQESIGASYQQIHPERLHPGNGRWFFMILCSI